MCSLKEASILVLEDVYFSVGICRWIYCDENSCWKFGCSCGLWSRLVCVTFMTSLIQQSGPRMVPSRSHSSAPSPVLGSWMTKILVTAQEAQLNIPVIEGQKAAQGAELTKIIKTIDSAPTLLRYKLNQLPMLLQQPMELLIAISFLA